VIARKSIAAAVALLGAGIVILGPGVSSAYAHRVEHTAAPTMEVGQEFEIQVLPEDDWDTCSVYASVTVENPSVITGGGEGEGPSHTFPMRAIGRGTTRIRVFFDGVGDLCPAVYEEFIEIRVIDDSDKSNGDLPSAGTAADPVSTFSGELHFHEPPDLYLGGPLPLYFQRYYASYLRRNFVVGDLGDNWRHNFEWSVHWTGNNLVLKDAVGKVTRFLSDGAGTWTQQNNLYLPYQLQQDGGEITVYDPRTRLFYVFEAGGKLATIEDGKGNTLTLSHSAPGGKLGSVSDDFGWFLRFGYTVGGKLQRVDEVDAGFTKRSVYFIYDGDNLIRFTNAGSKITRYEYADPDGADRGMLVMKTYPLMNTHYTQTYYKVADGANSGRVKTQTDADANERTFAYSGRDTTVTDPAGHSFTHTHSDSGELTVVVDQAGKRIDLAYDASGRRTSLGDRLGGTTSYAYDDESGQIDSLVNADGTRIEFTYASRTVDGFTVRDLARIDYPDGTHEAFTHDASGNVTGQTVRRGGEWTFTYNARGQVLTEESPLGAVSTYEYNADGTLASVTDHEQNKTTFGYDELRRLEEITHPDGSTRTFTWDNRDLLLTLTDERGKTTTLTYDDNGNLESLEDPAGGLTEFQYDAMDRLTRVEDPLDNHASFTYDSRGNVESVTDRSGDTVTYGYDERGRLVSVEDPEGNVRAATYDDERIPLSSTDPLGRTATFASDSMGRIVRTTSRTGGVTGITYDGMGRATSVTDPVGRTTAIGYDAGGFVSGVTMPGGVVATTYARNAIGLITAVTDPNGHDWLRGYDEMGRLTSTTDPLGKELTYEYDDRGRVSRIDLPESDVDLTYDDAGNLMERSYSDGTDLRYDYDDVGRLTTAGALNIGYDENGRITDSDGLGVTRDESGRIETITLAPGKTVTYTYDGRGLPVRVEDWTGGATTLGYDEAGRLTTITRPNGVTTTYSYDDAGRVIGIEDGSIARTTLTRDLAGRVVTADRRAPTAPVLTDGVTSRTFDAACQVAEFTYDALGRVTDDTTRTYAWDLASRLTSYTEGADTVDFTYDDLGYRRSRTAGGVTRDYVWNHALGLPSVSVEGEGASDVTFYVHTPGGVLLYSVAAADSSRRDYHYDETGNTLFLTDATGAVAASYAYGLYGDLLGETGAADNPFTWQGRLGVMREGAGGLYYMRARYYDSGTGRFLSRDPIRSVAPRSVNPYQYALGNPMRYTDPTGLCAEEWVPKLDPAPHVVLWTGREVHGRMGQWSTSPTRRPLTLPPKGLQSSPRVPASQGRSPIEWRPLPERGPWTIVQSSQGQEVLSGNVTAPVQVPVKSPTGPGEGIGRIRFRDLAREYFDRYSFVKPEKQAIKGEFGFFFIYYIGVASKMREMEDEVEYARDRRIRREIDESSEWRRAHAVDADFRSVDELQGICVIS
jgi:RHS repeat-associated protein